MKEPHDNTINARLRVQTRATVLVTHRGMLHPNRFSLEVLGLDGRDSEKSVPVFHAGEPKSSTGVATQDANYEEKEGF